LEALKSFGVTKPEIHLSADPALLIAQWDTDSVHSFLRKIGIEDDKKYCLLSVRPWKGFDAHIQDFAAAVEHAWKTYGLFPILYAMDSNRDEAACKAVAKLLHCPHMILHAEPDGRQVIALIQRMSLVISMRLHALIFASGQGIPMVGIVYDPKVSGFLDDLGQKLYLPLQEADTGSLRSLIDTALGQQPFDPDNLRRLQKLAEKNSLLAKRLLSES